MIEFLALRTVAAYRRALALAIAAASFITISYVGVRDVDQTAPTDAESALSMGAAAGIVAIVYAAASAGGEIARGGLALALLGDPARNRATALRQRFAAYALAGAAIGLAGAATAALLAYTLLALGDGPLPPAHELAARAAGTTAYGALMGVIGAALGLALRNPATAVITVLVTLLVLDPLFAGLSTEIARWGPGGAAGSITGSGTDDLPPAWAGALALIAYAAALTATATVLTNRRDVP